MTSVLLIVGILWIAAFLAHWRFIVICRRLAVATSDSPDGLKESEFSFNWKQEVMRRKLQSIKKGEFGDDLCDVASQAIFFDNLFLGLGVSATLIVITAQLVMNNR